MAARAGMADVIGRLRGMCDAPSDEYTVGSDTYWSDDQLQDVLDSHRQDIRRERLMVEADLVAGGALEYHDYTWRRANVEGAESGTAAWLVQDGSGSAWGTSGTPSYDPNYRARLLRVNSDTAGTALYLSYRSYDLERAAADVWEQKAAHVAARFDIRTDNHALSRSQLRESYLQMARIYRKRAGARVGTLVREDANP